MIANSRVKSVTLSARITRADGTAVELGEIARWHRNPVVRAIYALRNLLKR